MRDDQRMRTTLDIDPDHVHHDLAHDWFAGYRHHGWATCPPSENGFVRVLSNPAYGPGQIRPALLVKGLARFRASGDHVFWPDSVSLVDGRVFNLPLAPGPRQLTDVYLLGLAAKMSGCLATFDRTIPVTAVAGATASTLLVIAPAGDSR